MRETAARISKRGLGDKAGKAGDDLSGDPKEESLNELNQSYLARSIRRGWREPVWKKKLREVG